MSVHLRKYTFDHIPHKEKLSRILLNTRLPKSYVCITYLLVNKIIGYLPIIIMD